MALHAQAEILKTAGAWCVWETVAEPRMAGMRTGSICTIHAVEFELLELAKVQDRSR